MERSQQMTGSHTAASPSGQFIASIATAKLRICAAHAPERYTEINTRVQPKDVTGLRLNDDGDRVAIVSNRVIEVVDLQDDSHRVRLDNGSGGLGKFASADFVGADQLLVMWEFGKAKVWNLMTGKGADLADIKTTCTGDRWQLRPKGKSSSTQTQTLATLSRSGVDDVLHLYLPSLQKQIHSTKLPTTDAQSLSWSPDGRWLAVLDTPTASPSVHFYTPDGHLFRSYPSSPSQDPTTHSTGLGIKSLHWAGAGNSHNLALTRFDGKIVLLNSRTFTSLAIIEHHTIIDQSGVSSEQQAPIWQEHVSAAGERSYTAVSQPFSPPLSRTKASSEPSDLGVAEACFSSDGVFLATRDERMLNTVWIWDVASLAAHAVVVQHSNVRRMQWHPSRSDALMLSGGEGIAYLLKASLPREPPTTMRADLPGSPAMSWLEAEANVLPTILCATKSSFQLLYPEGRPAAEPPTAGELSMVSETADGEGEGDDSLLDMLSGRTPLPPRTEQSYTERIDIEVETEEGDSTTRMDDTFRGKQIFGGRRTGRAGDGGGGERDPFDDSQIF